MRATGAGRTARAARGGTAAPAAASRRTPLRRACSGLLWIGLAAASAACPAWGPAGHRLTAAIAERLLNDKAQAAVRALLASDLTAAGLPSGRTTLASIAVWADEIRHSPADQPAAHFDDVPVCGPVPAGKPWCAGAGCATVATLRDVDVLGDAGRSLQERNEALKWIVHLVADLHQPLHAADHGDRGGNAVQVALAGVQTRGKLTLHGAWDNELVAGEFGVPSNRNPPFALVTQLAREARALPEEQMSTDPDDWARESNQLARSVAYAYPGFACGLDAVGAPGAAAGAGTADTGSGAGTASGSAADAPIIVLSQSYQRRAEAVIRQRIVLGGARLAELLNAVLGQ